MSTESDLQKTVTNAGIYNKGYIENHTKFNKFKVLDPYNRVSTTKEYVFFTKPDLHIFSNGASGVLNPELATSSIFQDALSRVPHVLTAMQYSASKTYPFINLLSNHIQSNIDLPGITAGSVETSANIYGTKLSYRKESAASDEGHEFSIDFEDSKYLEIYMFFKLFDEYQRRKYFGSITPPDSSYTINKILHDQISIFKFIVADDGETILHYSKLYGCYPATVPRDSFSEPPAEGGMKYTVHWKSQFVEDMEPTILYDFNLLTANLGGAISPMYDNAVGGVNAEWVTAPYIAVQALNGIPKIKYKLKWKV